MPDNSGEGKIKRAMAQLENAEILLGGLPKRLFQPAERKAKIKALINEISQIQEKIKSIYKDELEEGE